VYQPLEDVLPYDDFSVRLPKADIPRWGSAALRPFEAARSALLAFLQQRGRAWKAAAKHSSQLSLP
jgi:hypothetical protein